MIIKGKIYTEMKRYFRIWKATVGLHGRNTGLSDCASSIADSNSKRIRRELFKSYLEKIKSLTD